MIFELDSPVLQTDGLVAAIEYYMEETFDPTVECEVFGTVRDVPAPTERIAYELSREALFNAFKHAEASRLDVEVTQGNHAHGLGARRRDGIRSHHRRRRARAPGHPPFSAAGRGAGRIVAHRQRTGRGNLRHLRAPDLAPRRGSHRGLISHRAMTQSCLSTVGPRRHDVGMAESISTVVVADDDEPVRRALAELIADHPRLRLVGAPRPVARLPICAGSTNRTWPWST